jgi:hypothetical protein
MRFSLRFFADYGLQLLALLSAAVCVSARADTLADLRTTLQRLSADAPIHGVLDVRSQHLDQEENDDRVPPGHLRLLITAGSGLGIELEPEQLQIIDQEQKGHDADSNRVTPVSDLVRIASPLEIGHLVAEGPALLELLGGASAPVVKPDALDGVPVRQLTVQIPILTNRKYSAYAYGYQGSVVLWLDAQGVPLAYQRNFHAKFCKFFLCITVNEQYDAKLKVVGGRLLAVSASDEFRQSGLGQGSHTRTDYALQLDGATPPSH